MMADGVHVIDGGAFRQTGFIATGVGTHGLYPSRDGTKSLYVANRGSNKVYGGPHGKGSVSRHRLRHPTRLSRPGRFPAAAAPTWAMSAPTDGTFGSRGASTMSSIVSTRRTGAVDQD